MIENYGSIIALIIISITSGVLVSILGGGGYSILIPLILFTGILENEKIATGTTLLAISLPIALITAMEYYNSDLVHLKYAGIICVFLIIGMLIGNKYIHKVNNDMLRKIVGVFLLFSGSLTLFQSYYF